jgi:hypothetical protein
MPSLIASSICPRIGPAIRRAWPPPMCRRQSNLRPSRV